MTLLDQYVKRRDEFENAKDDKTAAAALERANDLAEVIIISDAPMDQKLSVMLGYCSGLDHAGTMGALRKLQKHAPESRS